MKLPKFNWRDAGVALATAVGIIAWALGLSAPAFFGLKPDDVGALLWCVGYMLGSMFLAGGFWPTSKSISVGDPARLKEATIAAYVELNARAAELAVEADAGDDELAADESRAIQNLAEELKAAAKPFVDGTGNGAVWE